MLKSLEPVLPHIQNVALALGVLLVAYLLTLPLRRRYASCDGTDAQRPFGTGESVPRSGWQFVGAVANYVAFSVAVLVLSLPLIHWLDQAGESVLWPRFHEVWLLFWGVYALVRGQDPSKLDMKPLGEGFPALTEFGVTNFFVHDESLTERGLTAKDLVVDAQIVDSARIAQILETAGKVLPF